MRAAIIVLALAACARPEIVKADATAQSAAAAGTGASSSTVAQVKAAEQAQASSSAAVEVKRGARHVAISVTPATDGGAPTFKLELDEDADEISAASTGAADAGVVVDVDAGAIAAADAGAASSADAGAEAKVEPPRPPFWTLSRLVTLIAGIAAAVAIGFAILKLRPRP